MSFQTHHKNERQFSIKLTTTNGNTVGFINLSTQFCKAVLHKDEHMITAEDVKSINNNDIQAYIAGLTVEVEAREEQHKISIEDY